MMKHVPRQEALSRYQPCNTIDRLAAVPHHPPRALVPIWEPCEAPCALSVGLLLPKWKCYCRPAAFTSRCRALAHRQNSSAKHDTISPFKAEISPGSVDGPQCFRVFFLHLTLWGSRSLESSAVRSRRCCSREKQSCPVCVRLTAYKGQLAHLK